MTASSACVVDLALLRGACGPLIGCYERFLSEGSVALHDLDDALASLRVLPPLGGRLGRAVALVTSGGAGAPTEQTLAALELFGPPRGSGLCPKSLCLQLPPRTVPPGRLDRLSSPCLAWTDPLIVWSRTRCEAMVVTGSWSPTSTPCASVPSYDERVSPKPSTSASEVTRATPTYGPASRAVMPHRNGGCRAPDGIWKRTIWKAAGIRAVPDG
jgi:hypothetical protein